MPNASVQNLEQTSVVIEGDRPISQEADLLSFARPPEPAEKPLREPEAATPEPKPEPKPEQKPPPPPPPPPSPREAKTRGSRYAGHRQVSVRQFSICVYVCVCLCVF